MRPINRGLRCKGVIFVFYLYYLLGNACALCLFDPCMMSVECEGKKCVPDKCSYSCVCDVNSTSEDCLSISTPNPSNFSASGPPTVNSNTSADFQCPCVHGQCKVTDEGQIGYCECTKGWSGHLCNMSSCTLQCDPGLVCHRINDLMMACIPLETSPPEQSTLSTVTEFNNTTGHRSYNVCDTSYRQRPFSERSCYGAHECLYGICLQNNTVYRCLCDIGAVGGRCQNKCCKQCGGNGECDKTYGTEEEVCNCHINYTGEFCDIYDPPKGTEVFIQCSVTV